MRTGNELTSNDRPLTRVHPPALRRVLDAFRSELRPGISPARPRPEGLDVPARRPKSTGQAGPR
jgi:hypothetical protein